MAAGWPSAELVSAPASRACTPSLVGAASEPEPVMGRIFAGGAVTGGSTTTAGVPPGAAASGVVDARDSRKPRPAPAASTSSIPQTAITTNREDHRTAFTTPTLVADRNTDRPLYVARRFQHRARSSPAAAGAKRILVLFAEQHPTLS